jgi:phosphate transport system substrate-binding protein
MTPAFALCGPNAIWSRLGPDLVAGFLSSLGAQSPTIHASAADEQTVQGYVNGAQMGIRIATHGLAAAYDGLRNGQCQVSMASRRIKSVEAVSLRSLGNMLSPSAEHVVGLDGIAVIVNAANPVPALSIAQLKDIFTGRVTAWNAVGGSSGPIHVLAPAEKFGATDTFKTLVLDQATLIPVARRFEDSGGAFSRGILGPERDRLYWPSIHRASKGTSNRIRRSGR